jgi:hypothetical protein
MENWIGIGVWIVLGVLVGLAVKVLVKRPEETPGHSSIIMALGAFAAVIGGMLGVGIFSFYQPSSLSIGGVGGALVFASLMTWIYRWGIRSLI